MTTKLKRHKVRTTISAQYYSGPKMTKAVTVAEATRFPEPPRGAAGARKQLEAAVAANKHILDELAKY